VIAVERLEHPDGVARSYPAATVHNGVVYPCGQVPVDAGGATPPGLADQVRLVLSNLDATLRRAGADLSSILQITVYLDDPDGFPEYDAAYRAAFRAAPLPPRTTLFVAGFRGSKHIELTAVAAVTTVAVTGSAPTPD
jgi:2-iminobutanoate/2-iminopropanoate deaminase